MLARVQIVMESLMQVSLKYLLWLHAGEEHLVSICWECASYTTVIKLLRGHMVVRVVLV